MTDFLVLNWAVMAVSLFNTILLVWLGLAVLLNAERRSWGLWLASGEILLGGVFFLVHTIILGYGIHSIERSLNFWWRVGWVPVVTIPYVWYVVILWYAGFWDRFGSKLNRRHYPWFVGTSLLAVGIILLMIFANPVPSFVQISQLNLTATLSLGGIPVLIWGYPVYIMLCIALSVDVLRHPAPSGRIMGDLARRRARPWLIGAALIQILVSMLVGSVMFWVIGQTRNPAYQPAMGTTLAVFDLVIASLIALAVVLLGQAVTSYEVFTGKALPRHGLLRYWRRVVILAGGYAAVVGLSIAFELHPIFSVLLSALLMTVFYAMLSWRSFAERQAYVDQLRPFVTSQGLYDKLLTASPDEAPIEDAFQILCREVLEAQQAYLAAQGPLAPLAGEGLLFSTGPAPQPPDLAGILGSWISPEMICLPLTQDLAEDWRWVVPLWSERGLIGALVLGTKLDEGLYSQEEIEIARAVGERLIDTRASAEIARRLMALQRQRLAESQVVDRRTRRVLHDDILPRLHAALLSLNGTNQQARETIEALSSAHRQISDLLRDLPVVITPEIARQGLVPALHNTIETEFGEAFEEVVWDFPENVVTHLEQLPKLVLEVLYYATREAIRNAARYGSGGDGYPSLLIAARPGTRGLEFLIENTCVANLQSGNHRAGSGQGLALHSTMMAVIGGELSFEQLPGQISRVILRVPE